MFNDFYPLTQQCFQVFRLLKTSENHEEADITTTESFIKTLISITLIVLTALGDVIYFIKLCFY